MTITLILAFVLVIIVVAIIGSAFHMTIKCKEGDDCPFRRICASEGRDCAEKLPDAAAARESTRFYELGRLAFERGRPLECCPFNTPALGNQWRQGWLDAESSLNPK